MREGESEKKTESKKETGGGGVKARNNFEFAATAVFFVVLISILIVLAPTAEAARVPAQKTGSPVVLVPQIQVISPVSPFSSASSVSKAAPVSAEKQVPAQKIVGDSIPSFKKSPEKKAREVVCSDVRGEIDFHLQCSGNTVINGDTDVIHGGWLEVTGTLTFSGAYSLDVWQNGKFSVDNGVMQTSATSGYQVIVYPGGIINLTNADVSGSVEFVVESLFAGDANILGVYYHDNAKGLVITGQNAVVDEYGARHSKFYDNNNAGLEVWSGRSPNAPNVVRNSEFYATAPGEQNVGILVGGRNSVIGGNNDVHGNDVGVLLNYSGGNQVLNNNIHGNVKAGIKSFVASRVPDFVPAQTLFEKTEKNPVWSSVPVQPGGAVDMVENLQPNTISGNTITANGDGIVEYVLANNIDSAQDDLISGNIGYGVVVIDGGSRPGLENTLGSNGVGRMLYLASSSVGAWIYYINGLELPDGPFYVAFCEGDVNCLGATHNDARRYDDYTISYSRQPASWPVYFTSDLTNTSEIRNILGNATTFTPKFLTRNRSVDNNGNEIRYCEDAAHGFPDACRIRAVTLTRYGDWLGRSSEDLHSASYSGNWRPFHIFYDDGIRPNCNWWGALTFGYDDKGDKNNGQSRRDTEIQKTGQSSRHPAVKISSVPEIRAVTNPPAAG